MSGKKRSSPGADEEKEPVQSVTLNDEDAQKLEGVQNRVRRVELLIDCYSQEKLQPVYEQRREVTKAIPKFWTVALLNNHDFSFHVQHDADRQALNYLEDLWIQRDPKQPRCFTLEFYFKSNPYFSDTVLKKEYKYLPSFEVVDEKADEDGLTPSMLKFSWERDVQPLASKINWSDPEKALTKLYPRVDEPHDEEDEMSGQDDIPAEPGSFFNFFESADDPFGIGLVIANEVFPHAIDFFLGKGREESDLEGSDEDDDEDDDDEADEIDLEKPRSKRSRIV